MRPLYQELLLPTVVS
ncbi:MAG: hypothetical protein U0T81_01585 [Saprospiraceae bacterium]